MTKSVYVTDSHIAPEGHGGGVVSFHELNALTRVSEVSQIYQRVGELFYEKYYPQNPFMYDYYIASLLKEPETIDLAHFYGASFNLVTKRLAKARKYATVPAHNLEVSLQEWNSLGLWAPPPPHLTDDSLFRYLCHGLSEVTVVSPSTSSADYLKGKLGLNPVVIPHGTDIPPKFNVDRKDFRVFHLSQFGPDKGQIYLLRAWKKFGKGVLDMCCANLALNASLVTGFPSGTLNVYDAIPENQKDELYLNASVYVQPSVTEGWGLSVGEAMAHGTPVIITEGVGAKDMVVDGRDGFIVPIRDPDAITNALIYYHDNPSEVRRMGYNARITAERYSWQSIEQQYAKLYESV